MAIRKSMSKGTDSKKAVSKVRSSKVVHSESKSVVKLVNTKAATTPVKKSVAKNVAKQDVVSAKSIGLKRGHHGLELLSPAGSFETMMAAINAGADAVYFGVEQLNMRARAAHNFTLKDLPEIARICSSHGVKSSLALNTILYDHDIKVMQTICNAAKKAGINAVIASDITAIEYANSIGLDVHISTQCNVTNIHAVRFYARYATTIVLARELTLQQITSICDTIKKEKIVGPTGELIRIEIFIHGALCVAVSGKCYMSLATYNASANRGACLQNCRRSYRVIDEETGDELRIENKQVMSPSDLCTVGFIDKLIKAGAVVFKIEGRAKGPEYVHTVTKVYREAIDDVLAGRYSQDKVEAWTTELSTVYNRGFWQGGYYLGKKINEWSASPGTKATTEKVVVGKVDNYYDKSGVVCAILDAGSIAVGDKVIITGPTTGIVEVTVDSMMVDDKAVTSANHPCEVTFKVATKVRKNDCVYKIVPRKV